MPKKPLLLLFIFHFSFFILASAEEIRVNKTTKPPKTEYKENFVRNSVKEVVVDKNRALMWQDDARTKTTKRNWSGAKGYCQSLSHAGYDDWRLPTMKELESIAESDNYPNAVVSAFKNSDAGHYWSSSEGPSNSGRVWRVNFKYGSSYNDRKSSELHVRCVRGN